MGTSKSLTELKDSFVRFDDGINVGAVYSGKRSMFLEYSLSGTSYIVSHDIQNTYNVYN